MPNYYFTRLAVEISKPFFLRVYRESLRVMANLKMVDHYLVLGLPTGEEGTRLTEREITRAFKAKALEIHPDKRPRDQAAAAHSEFQNLYASYQILVDVQKRQEFDAILLAYLRWFRRQQEEQNQWKKIRIPRRPMSTPNQEEGEERKKRQRPNDEEEEEERKKRQKTHEQLKKYKEVGKQVSKFLAKILKELEELEEMVAAGNL